MSEVTADGTARRCGLTVRVGGKGSPFPPTGTDSPM